ncbi:hypothetical protein HMPREF1257_02356 [Corynebacterium sp. KPL1814]|nr:hypothetical protein HMPREF1257_02356 [Corynebacterium sp. KPL1814]ERS76709.1 hypothetical protein HMPREF1285_01947 [Corynebacterium sp. KPL1859]
MHACLVHACLLHTNFGEMIAVKEWKASIATAFVHISARFLTKRGCFGQPEAQPYLLLRGGVSKSQMSLPVFLFRFPVHAL